MENKFTKVEHDINSKSVEIQKNSGFSNHRLYSTIYILMFITVSMCYQCINNTLQVVFNCSDILVYKWYSTNTALGIYRIPSAVFVEYHTGY
jgi:hypothetical protein